MDENNVSQCMNSIDKIIDIIATCVQCIDIYIDYSLLRYPYIILSLMLMNCNNVSGGCEKHLYDIIIELGLNIESIHKGFVDIDKDMIFLRAKCFDSWFEYGYTVSNTLMGTSHIAREFTIFHRGKRIRIEPSTNLVSRLRNMLNILIERARAVIESEGII